MQHDGWLEKMEITKPLEIVGNLRHDPIFNRLVGSIPLFLFGRGGGTAGQGNLIRSQCLPGDALESLGAGCV